MKPHRFEKHPTKTLILIVIVFLFFAVFAAEMILSLVEQKPPVILVKSAATGVRNIRLRESLPSTIQIATPADSHLRSVDTLEKKAFRFETDEDGYITPSRIHEQPDITILFLGGSTTECKYVGEENRFPYLAGRLLEESGKKINSINSGVDGNHSMHSMNILLNKGLALNPDIVVMMHNINDLATLMHDNTYWNENTSRSLLITNKHRTLAGNMKDIVRKIVPRLYFGARIVKAKYWNPVDETDEFAHSRGKRLAIDERNIFELFAGNLQAFINVSRAYGIIPVLMTQANRFKENPDSIIIKHMKPMEDLGIAYQKYRSLYVHMNEIVREVGSANHVLVIDLAKEVPRSNSYLYDPVHFNDNGSRYVARLIADRLEGISK
ncbi:MAG: SGNH/GDSL hydrolase family protein [Candidatus Thiosymbion ectosymbiont of Robbea hypermnestra]|nr:SGNH/GDSL hydrolase family protein [Candidatus Thiosymbion ectosymbiont of Robbea hypermnestra]